MKLVTTQQGEQAVRVLSGAAIACYQFLTKDDYIVKQALKYVDRIMKVVNKIPALADLKQAFEISI